MHDWVKPSLAYHMCKFIAPSEKLLALGHKPYLNIMPALSSFCCSYLDFLLQLYIWCCIIQNSQAGTENLLRE